jgi:NodT family efflux transporter outer membrane factor (OMF) lipoprotein
VNARATAFLSSFVAFCCASACAPKAQYSPPVPVQPAVFKENANWKPAQPRDAEVRGSWWDIFNDPVLADLEAKIDVSNQSLKVAEAQFIQARATVRGARANLYPQVSAAPALTAAQTSANRTVPGTHDPYLDLLLTIDASYEVDVWGRLHGIVAATRANAQATAADLETARLSLHAELALDYFVLRGLDREHQILNSATDAYAQALELTQNRFRGGLASAADVAQAETQLETTRAQAVDLRVDRATLEHAIALLIGELPATVSIPPSPIDVTPPDVPLGVPSELLERRADIAAAERRVAGAFADVGVAQSAFYPLLTLSGSVGFASSSFGNWLSTTSNFWTLGPSALINVLDFGRRRAAVAEARAAHDLASATYQQAVLTAFREVEDQLAALRVLEEEAAVQDRAIAASQRSLTLANNRYRGGVASYLEVITAQSFALANERAGVNLLTRRMTATVLLLKGLGGDWRPQQALMSAPPPL